MRKVRCNIRQYLGNSSPASIAALGSLDILQRKLLALFCSVKCPGNLILQTHHLAQHLCRRGVTVIGGFHSPMERECLRILLRGMQPVIICPARSIEGMRIRAEYKQPLADGRLLLLSPFAQTQQRITAETAVTRTRFVAALAGAIFVAHAESNSKTQHFCRDVLAWRKPLYTLESDANVNLMALGAKPVTQENISAWT